jgi:hypothetical protein
MRVLSLAVVLITSSACAADAPEIQSLRTERKGETIFFSVSLRPPRDFWMTCVENSERGFPCEASRRRLARLPSLAPQDKHTSAVFCTTAFPTHEGRDFTLRFAGKVHGNGKAKLLLVYPTKTPLPESKSSALLPVLSTWTWAESPLIFDFGTAEVLKPYQGVRSADRHPDADDLEGQWAEAQARYFSILETQASEFGFYSTARELTSRKYHVLARSLFADNSPSREKLMRQLYETTTGAAALTQSLALSRLRNPKAHDDGKRTIAVEEVPGIDIAEHPWKRMMGDNKPNPEPLAALTPFDFYYISFDRIASLLDLGDLLDQWGGNFLKGYEITSRDYHLRQRYEKQLCLRRTNLARTLGPTLVRGVAVVGSDVYLREGSDVTIIFHVRNRALFLAAVEPFVQATRTELGHRLEERKSDYRGVAIESLVTDRREVSLHRAAVGDFVVYSNSPAALRRVLDTQAGRRKSLAESLDFQYMRTVFRKNSKDEDGFAFLSDAFIRRLVGPASKTKEKRRLEALTSLHLMTDAALLVAWEKGRLPADRDSVLAASGLKEAEIAVPEGGVIAWDGKRREAYSDAYNTIAFTTPLIEMSLDNVTPREAADYKNFRTEYLNLWRRYFDPVGMRFSLRDSRVRVETYILPLIDGNGYAGLRSATGEGTTQLDAVSLSPKTLMQWTHHVGPLMRFLESGHDGAFGDQFFLRCDDSRKYRELGRLWIQHDFDPNAEPGWEWKSLRATWQLPITLGIRVGKQNRFDEWLKDVGNRLEVEGSNIKPAYKGVSIRRCKINDPFVDAFNETNTPKNKRFVPVFYHAAFDGFWYASTSLDSLRDAIDRAQTVRENRENKIDKAEFNSSLYLSRDALFSGASALGEYLEWESHRRAVSNNPIWLVLHRGKLLEEFDSTESRQLAMQLFGFVPISPDDSAYRFDARHDEVNNAGYGSIRRPKLRDTLQDKSPVGRWLEQLRTVRVDLRFREDGVQTILTLDRNTSKK